jgi:hypothetical protein
MVLNPVAKSTTVVLTTLSAGSSLTLVQVEFSLDDPTILGGPAATWALLSSATAMPSSLSFALAYTVLSPIAQVRLNSTLNAGSSGAFILKALQSISA